MDESGKDAASGSTRGWADVRKFRLGQLGPLEVLRGGGPTSAGPAPLAEAVIDCGVYVDGGRLPGEFAPCAAIETVRERGDGFVWIGLRHPDKGQMRDIAECFDLHPLAVEDAIQAHQRPKLDRYDGLCFLVLRTVRHVVHDLRTVSEIVQTGEIMIFLGADFVVTVRHGDFAELDGVRHRLEARPDLLASGPAAVLHAITDHVVDSYVEVAEHFERDVEAMAEDVFDPRRRVVAAPIYQLKGEVVEFRRSVVPLGAALQEIVALDAVPKEVRRYLRDVVDHQISVAERINEFDESLSALIDAAQAMVSLRQNSDMRKISAWVAIIGVPTAIAGCYGMNFDNMPELHWQYGYFAALVGMVGICLALFVTFRHNDWL